KPAAHQCYGQRDQPDGRNAAATFDDRLGVWRGVVLWIIHALFPGASCHSKRASKVNAATMVSTTTAANDKIAEPGWIHSNGLACTRAARMATTNTSIMDQRPMRSTK